jgi:hypothetical protein
MSHNALILYLLYRYPAQKSKDFESYAVPGKHGPMGRLLLGDEEGGGGGNAHSRPAQLRSDAPSERTWGVRSARSVT